MTDTNLSFVRYVGDGVTTQFTLTVMGENMGYFRTTDIHAYVKGVEVPNVINMGSPHLVNITPAPAVGDEILIRREMPIDKPYSNFERGNNFGHRQVNNTFLQQLYLTQELLDGFLPSSFYCKEDLSIGGNKITNLAKGTDELDAVNYKQVLNLLSGEGVAPVVPILNPRQQGDGVTIVFNTPADKTTPAEAFFVNLSGVSQRPYTDYRILLNGNIEFDKAPETGVDIDITLFTPEISVVVHTTYNTVSDMVALSNNAVGDLVHTKGYYTIGDGGGAGYIVSIGSGNGFSNHTLSNSTVAVLQVQGSVDIQQCGAIPQNDKRYNELDDALDAHAALSHAFSSFKSVTGSGRYLCKGVLRTPKHYGTGMYKDDYRWKLQGQSELEIVLDLTVVPLEERGNGFAVGFGLSHKDYTKPDEWENGSDIYDGLQRNISIRDVSFWNRNWNTTDQDNNTLELEVGVGIFAGAEITIDNMVVWGFKANFMTSCWASCFTNVRPRNGEYGFVPYAGTTITANAIFAGSNKHGITTAGVAGLHSTNPTIYGLVLNGCSVDHSREIGYRLSGVRGCVVNIPSMESITKRGITIDDYIKDLEITGNVLTPFTNTQERIINIESLTDASGNISINNFHAEANEVRSVMLYINNIEDCKKIKLKNVTCGNPSLLTNCSTYTEQFMRVDDTPHLSQNILTPVNNQVLIPEVDLIGMANDYGTYLDTDYDFYLYGVTVKISDGINFFIFEYDLVSTRVSDPSRIYSLVERHKYDPKGSISPPTMRLTVGVVSTNLRMIFDSAASPGTPWNILGCDLQFKARN